MRCAVTPTPNALPLAPPRAPDYALSMELKAAGFKGRYLPQYLAVGEAPEEARNIFRQRSRWTKGHMQVGKSDMKGCFDTFLGSQHTP